MDVFFPPSKVMIRLMCNAHRLPLGVARRCTPCIGQFKRVSKQPYTKWPKFVRCWFSHGTVESIQAPDEIYFGALEQNIG